MKKIIYLTGLPRAMTTLMANTIANNPKIGGGETSPMLEYIYAARANYTSTPEVKAALTKDKMHKSFLSFCRKGLEGYAEEITEKEIYIDKSRGWVHYAPFLWELYPNAKIVLMVRDLRSILSSFEKKWRDNPSILDTRDNPSQQNFVTIDQRVNHWLNDAPLGIALKRIYNAVQTKTIDKMCVIRAEEFCKNPKEIMKKVYHYIDEPYFDLDYSNIEQVTIENDRIGDFGIYGDHKIRNSIEPLKKDYDDLLTTQISQSVKNNYKWFYETFDYI